MNIRISDTTLGHLSAGTIDGNVFRMTAQLARPDYMAVNKVLEACGGKWNRKVGGHVFGEPAADLIEGVLLTGTYRRTKQDFGQFDTPEDLAHNLALQAEIKPGMDLLEPSAGIGNLIVAAESAGARVSGYEIDVSRRLKARERCRVPTDIMLADFMLVAPEPAYDRILMNPPFAKQADIDACIFFDMCERRLRFTVVISDKRTKAKTEQHVRSTWRALFICIKGKIEGVQAGIETFDEAFLSHVVVPGSDKTIYEHMRPSLPQIAKGTSSFPALPAPGVDAAR